ncbi:GNAT family N-acetyltransferase [Nocardioides sp.]|uniref:GNAT family N-acetyltransferase n=1 Tax=Nocardioides sp. TaxID=35761 RepID=UPI002B278D07|nr:GNAT family N-acetyltransferase [Nocardioides sp.]
MERLTQHADLLAASANDPWVRWYLPDPFLGEVWVHDGVALVQRLRRRPGFWVAPLAGAPVSEPSSESARVRAALVALRDGGHFDRLEAASVSVVQGHAAVAHEVLDLAEGGDWEWMWCAAAPPRLPQEDQVVALDDTADAAELEAFTRAHNPRVWTEVGSGRVQQWRGLRDDSGALVAIGGAEVGDAGAPHLAGIVTAGAHRGQGYGSVVSAALTRWALEQHGVCTLGMFSDNHVARGVYERLGFRTARAWHSRALMRRAVADHS